MYCPEHILINRGHFMLTMYGSADIPKRYVPLSWWINPLRYEVIIRRTRFTPHIRINREGLWRIKVSNWLFRIKRAIRANG